MIDVTFIGDSVLIYESLGIAEDRANEIYKGVQLEVNKLSGGFTPTLILKSVIEKWGDNNEEQVFAIYLCGDLMRSLLLVVKDIQDKYNDPTVN